MATIIQEQILAARNRRYRRTHALRVQTPEAARDFVEDVGFCHFWPITGVEMPSLLHAIAGRERGVPMAHADPDGSKCWGWKDGSLGQRWWYYGKVLRRKATLISLEVLPSFYACSKNYGELDDYLEEYRSGTMTLEARQIYEALLHHGPLDTVRLRREARLAAESAKSRFERALVELQVGFKILPTGIAEAGAWRYAFVYDILPRHLPQIPVQAREIKRSEARRTLVRHYLNAVVAAERSMVRRIFHVLNWTPTELQRTIDALIDEDLCREVVVEGLPRPVLLAIDEFGK
jgi:hypothetical protein